MFSSTHGYRSAIISLVAFALIFTLPAFGQEAKSPTRASRILDRDVYDRNNELIGEVADIVVRRSGRAKKLIVEYGGFFDLADRLVALSFKRFEMRPDGVFLEVTRQQLDKKPDFDFSQQGLITQYYYYSTPPRSFPAPNYSYDPTMQRRGRSNLDELAFSPSHYLASVIMQQRLVNSAGRTIGWIDDLEIDLSRNNVANLIVATGLGLADIADTETLPYRPMGISGYGLIYDISSQELNRLRKKE